MMGPHQSIIDRLTSMGHGAAAWIATRSVDRSCASRCSSSSLSMRTNMVGTNWACVTANFSIAASEPAASNFSMITTVPPARWQVVENASGAA